MTRSWGRPVPRLPRDPVSRQPTGCWALGCLLLVIGLAVLRWGLR